MAEAIQLKMAAEEQLNPLTERIEQIRKQAASLDGAGSDHEGTVSADGQNLHAILAEMERMSAELEAKDRYIEQRTQRLNGVLDVLLEYTVMNFKRQIPISEEGDEIDAVAVGMNTLGEELNAHIEELKLKSEDLMRSNKQLEQFVYVASHDLQEPLKTLSNYVELLKDDNEGKLDEDSEKYLTVINNATTRMRSLVRDLLDYARLGKTRNVIEVNGDALLKEVLTDISASVQQTGATIDVGPMPIMHGHHTELKSLFQNLVGNAIKFHKPGQAPHVEVSATRGKGLWFFKIKDNGIGIEPQYHERIFSIFQKLHTQYQYSGTGIGLAHCRKIVEDHGGRIWVESEPEGGSTFVFTLPENGRQ